MWKPVVIEDLEEEHQKIRSYGTCTSSEYAGIHDTVVYSAPPIPDPSLDRMRLLVVDPSANLTPAPMHSPKCSLCPLSIEVR